MKKRLLFLGVFCVFISVLGISSISAAPSAITVKRAEVLNDIVTNHDHGFTIFNTSDGKIIYCMDVDKKALVTGQTATYVEDGDAGLLYILQNGYPNKQITGNDNIDKYITQATVWWYLDESKLSNEFKNAGTGQDIYSVIPNYIKPMVSAARTATDTQKNPTIKLTTSGTQLILSSDKKYYESKYMAAVTSVSSTYEVTASGYGKIEVVDASGNVGTTMNSSEKFKVRVPASIGKAANINVKVSTNANIYKAKVYKPSDTTYQRVVGLYADKVVAEDNATLNVNPNKHICEYTGGKYYDENGNVTDKTTYEKQCLSRSCEYIDGIYYGKDGSVVDKNTFDRECSQEIIVPNTGANIVFWSVGLGVLAIAIGTGILMYANRKKEKTIK